MPDPAEIWDTILYFDRQEKLLLYRLGQVHRNKQLAIEKYVEADRAADQTEAD